MRRGADSIAAGRAGARRATGAAACVVRAIAGVCCVAAAVGCASTPSARRDSALPTMEGVISGRGSHERAPRGASPSRDVIVEEESWTYAGRDGVIITTPHFRLHTTVQSSLLRDRFPRFLELALASYRSALGDLPEPGRRLDSFVMQNRAQWESLTRTIAGAQAPIYLRIPRGGFAVNGKGVYYDIGAYDTFSIAGHEGWHQYTQATFRQPLPLWLEEGIAAYFEGFRWHPGDPTLPIFLPWSNPERFDMLRQIAGEDRLIPLAELLVSRPQDLLEQSDRRTLSYYAQVWALTHFLREGADARYRAGLRELLDDVAHGRLFARLEQTLGPREARRALSTRVGDAVFRVYFNADLAEAAEEYRRFVRAATLPGARHHVTAGRSPVEQ